MKFTIDRSKWRCGGDGRCSHGQGPNGLLNGKGYMCCLGQISLQLGATKKEIRGKGMPSSIAKELLPLSKKYSDTDNYCFNTELSDEAANINDSTLLTKRKREKQLRELFNKHNHQIVFTGKYE